MTDSGSDRFDRSMRELHAQSLQRLSPATRSQLRAARTAATTPARRVPGWPLGTAFAALAVVAITLRLQPAGPDNDAAPAPGPAAPLAAAAVVGPAATALEESPDLYLWLASSDVIASTTPSDQARP